MAAEEEKPYLPSCWNDDAKMTALFSPFRTSTANPEGVASKVKFWKTCIDSFCKTSERSTFTVEQIIKAFTRNGRTPQCISSVIEEIEKSGEVYKFNAFMQIKPINKTEAMWSAWAWEISKSSLSWTWSLIKNTVLPSPPTLELKYVHKQAVQNKADDLLKHASDLRGKVVQLNELIEKCNWPKSDTEDALLAIYWLYCQNKAAVVNFDFNAPSKVLVKLAACDETKVSISDTDLCKYNLLKLSAKTETRIAEYEEKCHQAREEARVLISKNSKVLALNQLKKKKMFEEVIKKEANILNNVQCLLETLNQTESNQEVIEALKTANAAIKHTQKEANLTEDTVLDVMDDLRDTIEAQENINSAISQSVVPQDNEDLEKEFENLLQDIATEDDLCKWVENLKLPDLPESPKSVSTAPTKDMEGETL